MAGLTVQGGTSAAVVDSDSTPKALRTILYGPDGNSVSVAAGSTINPATRAGNTLTRSTSRSVARVLRRHEPQRELSWDSRLIRSGLARRDVSRVVSRSQDDMENTLNDLLHWLPAVLPTLAFAVGWGMTRAQLERVREDLREAREENKSLRAELHEVREDLHKVREAVARLDERSGREPTGRHTAISER